MADYHGSDPLNRGNSSSSYRSHDPLAGRSAAPTKKSGGGGGLLHAIEKYSGAQLVGNLAKDVGTAAVGVGPGLYTVGKGVGNLVSAEARFNTADRKKAEKNLADIGKGTAKQYADYYGHNVAHHIYQHPLQPILDALTVASLGAGAAAKVGEVGNIPRLASIGERATLETRSPRRIATGKGPVHKELTSTAPLVKGREVLASKAHTARTNLATSESQTAQRIGLRGGEFKRYGKQIQAQANQHALGHLTAFEPYAKATRRLSKDEWTALHVRALDIHPEDLKALWKGSPAEKTLTPDVARLAVNPSKRMQLAEPEARRLSLEGEQLYKSKRLLKNETARAREELTKRQASEILGRPVKPITGKPYYFPHTIEPPKNVSPLVASGGGKGVPRKLGSMKQSTGILALKGKLHLRSDVLGPDFLRRVKYLKYDEIHNALVRGAVRVTRQQIEQNWGGKLPKGYEYIRTKPSTRIPATIRAEGEQHIPIDKLIPNPEDLHASPLGEGFSTTDQTQAHVSGGKFYIVPKQTVRAATGEFTKSNDFVRNFIRRPLTVWRAAVLGLRVGFLTNNLIGNSVMYAVKTGGQGALRDLFGAIMETHGPKIAKDILDDPATPAALRAELERQYPQLLYHGSPKVFGQLDVAKADPNALYGPGIYLTDNPRVASGYATSGGVSHREPYPTVDAAEARAAALEKEGIWSTVVPENAYDFNGNKRVEWIVAHNEGHAPNVRIVRAHVGRPFDLHDVNGLDPKEAARLVRLARITSARAKDVLAQASKPADQAVRFSGEWIYDLLAEHLGKPATNALLREAGYDAITHVGGLVTGGETHNVTIVLDPKRIAPTPAPRPQPPSSALPAAIHAPDLYKQYFPEQGSHGTFGRTQSPATSPAHIAGRHSLEAARAVTGALPKLTSKVAEELPRKALIRHYIRHSPEFKKVYTALPKETRTFETAARKILDGKGSAEYQRYISKRVDQALGNYTNLSPMERNVLRNALPFYSWYRAIVVTTYHLAVDTPLRANLLTRIGRIGSDASANALGPVPTFLQGAIPLGQGPQGTKRVLSTQGLNPYATLAQLERGVRTDISSLGLNPFVEGPLRYAQRGQGNISPAQIALAPLRDLLLNLPPSRLIAPSGPSKLYPTRHGRKPQLLGYVGAPVKEYSPSVAAQQAAQGR